MQTDFPLFPDQASSFAIQVDALYFGILALCVFFALLVVILVVIFAIKYQRKSDDEVPQQIAGHLGLEIFWTAIPLVLALGVFVVGNRLIFSSDYAPAKRHGNVCGGQTVDVEIATSRGQKGN